jgi:quinol-cytochrome oxidoreductase complex cytochrome b subunit
MIAASPMLRVFITGAYKKPRELNWVAGMLLLLLTLAFGFTGYLLPWDQKALWGSTVGSEIVGAIPFVGDALLGLLRGGPDITGLTYSFLWDLTCCPAHPGVHFCRPFLIIRQDPAP